MRRGDRCRVGDGSNNRGRPAALARDDAIRAGITINGLPILALEPNLDRYDRGTTWSAVPAPSWSRRRHSRRCEAVLKKLITEIADLR